MTQPAQTDKPTFQIEKGVPIPETRGAISDYPFSEMAPGDSIFVPESKGIANARWCAGYYGRSKGLKFCTRKMDGGLRIWRLS